MESSTTIFTDAIVQDTFCDQIKYIDHIDIKRIGFSIDEDLIQDGPVYNDNVYNLISDQKKIIIFLSGSFYHFWMNSLKDILVAYEYDPTIKFVLDVRHLNDIIDNRVLTFAKKALSNYGVDFEIFNAMKYRGMNINNFYIGAEHFRGRINFNPTDKLFELFSPYIKDKSVKPYRKVFFSRTALEPRDYSHAFPEWSQYPQHLRHDNRVDDPERLEQYFEDLGFEVVRPERTFATLEDQISYMYTIKTMVSLTSSGISNAIFMQPGQTVLEISSPLLLVGNGNHLDGFDIVEELHHFFFMIGYYKRHTYLTLPLHSRSTTEAIEKLDSTKYLQKLLRE